MCRRVTCKSCGKATYAGCGQHVEQVLGGLSAAERCSCPPAPARTGGLLGRLFGR